MVHAVRGGGADVALGFASTVQVIRFVAMARVRADRRQRQRQAANALRGRPLHGRLARNVHFVSGLLESGVPFVAADHPEADRTMLQMLAVFAEHEARQTSAKTKAALAAARARGVRLGSPTPEVGAGAAAVKAKAAAHAREVGARSSTGG